MKSRVKQMCISQKRKVGGFVCSFVHTSEGELVQKLGVEDLGGRRSACAQSKEGFVQQVVRPQHKC